MIQLQPHFRKIPQLFADQMIIRQGGAVESSGATQGKGLGALAPHFWATWPIPLIFFTSVPIPEDELLTKP